MRSRAITLGTSSENNDGALANPEEPQNGQSTLKSSGTSLNFRNTVASRKSPVAGSPVRLNATAPVWPNTFQRPCARSIAAAGAWTFYRFTNNDAAVRNIERQRHEICNSGHGPTYSIIPIL